MTQTESLRQRVDQTTETVQKWWKNTQMVLGICALASALWVQFIGDGIRHVAQDFLGVSDLSARLQWVEEFMPAPAVVDWNEGAARQDGPCFPGIRGGCGYVLAGARTDYGDTCGRPTSVTPFVRLQDGRMHQSNFVGLTTPVELGRTETSFPVSLDIPSFMPTGRHSFRVRVVYPNCPGRNEPIPRWTPWFPLTVTTATGSLTNP